MSTHNNSRQSLNGHSSTNGRNHINGLQTSNHINGHQTSNQSNGHQTSNGLNGVPGNRNENDAGGMTVTATVGTSSPRMRRRVGSRPDSGVGVSVTQQVMPGHGQSPLNTTAATLMRPGPGNGGNSTVHANYSVHSNSHHNTNGNVVGHVSIGQVKEEVDQKPQPQPQQKEPVKPECNGNGQGHHQHGHQNGHHHHHHRPEPPKPVPVPETMDIRVQFFNNNRIKTFTVLVSATVDDLLRAIKEKCVDMPIEQMRLVYAGKNLERGVKLSRYDIKGTVLLTGRLRGG